MKPVIGITPSLIRDTQPHGVFERYLLSANYPNAVLAAGGVPVILPPQDDHAGALLDRLDGLLLSGGADIDPAEYGETEVHPATYDVSPLRDRFEFALLREALDRDLPILCICRGIQVLNVGLGGTLYQDIADQYGRQILHRQQEAGIEAAEASHAVIATDGGLLAKVYGVNTFATNSFHHQAIKTVAPNLAVEARTEDGLVEAVSLPGRSFVLGVQWHPEMMFGRHDEHLRPFEQLVATATARSLVAARG
jgi:putative glutamine amidotransferase